MGVKYSKFITSIGALTFEPVTILVECIKAEGFQGISIESLEGEYDSTEEFSKHSNRVMEDMKTSDKIYNFLPLTLPDARQLVEMLNEALAASEVG